MAEARRLPAQRALPQRQGQVRRREPRVARRTSPSAGNGCVAADFNGDGFTDLFVSTAVDDKLLWNNGNGTFTQGARPAGVVSFGWHAGAAVADVNGDGRPDLFVAGYTNPNAPIPNSVAGFPTNHHRRARPPVPQRGQQRERAREVPRGRDQAGLERSHFEHGLGAVFTDVNGDGRPDLYVANDKDPNRLYINVSPAEREGRARSTSTSSSAARRRASTTERRHGRRPGRLQRRRADRPVRDQFARAAARRLREQPAPAGTIVHDAEEGLRAALQRNATVGWGDSWVDLNNDGKSDLSSPTARSPSPTCARTPSRSRCSRTSRGADGSPVGNASGVVDPSGLPKIIGRGLAAADFNNDGHVDVAINSIGGPLVLLENRDTSGNWLTVSLDGFHPGAVVTATLSGGRKLVEEVHAGSSYLSSEDPRLHFGLGSATKVSSLVVRYPDGSSRGSRTSRPTRSSASAEHGPRRSMGPGPD